MTLGPHFQDTGKNSFFGDFVYERIVPKDHFLVALENLFDWKAISQELIGAYRGRRRVQTSHGEGAIAHAPVIVGD